MKAPLSLCISSGKKQKIYIRQKIAACIFLVAIPSMFSANAYAEELSFKDCLNVLAAGMYNRFLENYCGFDGGVGDRLKQIYTLGGCRTAVPQEVVDSMANEVTDDSSSRMRTLGEDAFCAGNKDAYYALREE